MPGNMPEFSQKQTSRHLANNRFCYTAFVLTRYAPVQYVLDNRIIAMQGSIVFHVSNLF